MSQEIGGGQFVCNWPEVGGGEIDCTALKPMLEGIEVKRQFKRYSLNRES